MRLLLISEAIRDQVVNKSKVNVANDKQITLQRKALDLLVFLYINQNKTFTRDDIVKKLWDGAIVGGRVIDIYIMDIRKKIGKDCIISVPSVGYKFNPKYQLELTSSYPKESLDAMNEAMSPEYRKWRKANVSYRGSSKDAPTEANTEQSGVMGKGLYSTPSSNKSMAKQYGKVWILVGAVPKKPLVIASINNWEIWLQNLMMKVVGGEYPDERAFSKMTTIEDEVQKLGYDGVIISGREMVAYNPEDVRFFETEAEVEEYYNDAVTDVNEGFDTDQISFGDVESYKGTKKVGSNGEFNFYSFRDLHEGIIAAVGDQVVGEVTFNSKEKFGRPIHTAQVDTEYRGKGLYLAILKIATEVYGPIASYPFDFDSEQERSESANKFWAKNGKIVGKEDGEPIYVLK